MASNQIINDDIYKMTSNPRESCITLNVLNFDGNFDGSKTCDKHGMTSLNLAAPRGRLDLVKHLKQQ